MRAFIAILALLLPRVMAAGEPGIDSLFVLRSHAAHLHILPAQRALEGCDTVRVTHHPTGRSTGMFAARLWRGFSVESCLVNGTETRWERSGDLLLLPDPPADTMWMLTVSYHASSLFQSEYSRLVEDRAILRLEECLPYPVKASMPVLDVVALSVTAPTAWRLFAPGDSIAAVESGDERTTAFRLRGPVPMLGWLSAGSFNVSAEGRIRLALYSGDTIASGTLLTLAGSALAFYEEKFSRYRFSSLTIVETDDWVAGQGVLAIAMPGIVLVKRKAFTTNVKFDRAEAILPHEIAHQWWALTVFVPDEDNAFLSEGMCEYSAYCYAESHGRMSARDSLQRHPLLRPLMMRAQEGKDHPLREKADLRAMPTQYLKALLVRHMLRKLIGDSADARLFRAWAQRCALRYASQEDFRKLAEEVSGKELGWFFDQWTERTGIPRLRLYNVKSTRGGGGWVTAGRVRLSGYDRFTLPVEIGVRAGDSLARTEIWLGIDSSNTYHNDVGFSIRTMFKPASALLDPSGDLLKIIRIPVKLSDLREPGDAVAIVNDDPHTRALASQDSAAMANAGWSVQVKRGRDVTLADLQGERVLVYGRESGDAIVAGVLSRFPFQPRGDTLRAGVERLVDRSLTLIQAMESSYSPHGMTVWICPMSDSARSTLLPYEASWVILRDRDEIASGVWEVEDAEREVRLP